MTMKEIETQKETEYELPPVVGFAVIALIILLLSLSYRLIIWW